MRRPGIESQRLVALFALGCVLFNYPLLSLFNLPETILGLPALHAYLFLAWALVVLLVAWTLDRRS